MVYVIWYNYNTVQYTMHMKASCGCRCMQCKSMDLESVKVGEVGDDGYFDMHHTCKKCGIHFDHLEGVTFRACDVCGYES